MNLLIKIVLFLITILLLLFLLDRATGLKISMMEEWIDPYENTAGAEIRTDEDDENDKDQARNAGNERIQIVDGYKAIKIEQEVIDAAGLKFESPVSRTFTPEFTAYAEVIDITPLVTAKTRYSNMQADIRVLKNDLQSLDLNLKRALALHKTNSLSTGELEKHRADRNLKAAEIDAMNTHLENLAVEIESGWGKEISQLVLDRDRQDLFDRLTNHQSALVQVSLLKDNTLEDVQQKVYVSSRNRRDTAQEVKYLDRAIHVNNQLHGESYFYLLDSGKFLPGNRLFTWIEESGNSITGWFIPENAVIWYANEPWIYTKHDEQLFVRKPLLNARKLVDGWLVQEGINEDDFVVSHGGQTLLSEEFKWAIPNEDDD